jgi:integrase
MATEKHSANWYANIRKDGVYGDGGNLWLQVTNGGAGKSWLFRWTERGTGRDRSMGLGSAFDIDVEEARDLARTYRRRLKAGKDPKVERDGAELDAEIAEGRAKTVRQVFDEWYEAKIAHRSHHTRKQVVRRIVRYVLPTIGDMPIQKIDSKTILDTVGLRRLWMEQNPTAVHLHSFLKRMFSFAIASKYYQGENPAAWRDHLEHVLAASKDVHKVTHQPSLAYKDVGRFLDAIRRYEDRSIRKTGHPNVALLLEWVVLTGVRISEARHATWSEIDEATATWTIPPDREGHKVRDITGEPHLVPITKPMWAVLREMERRYPDHAPDTLIFPSPRKTEHGSWHSGNTQTPFNVGATRMFINRSLKWDIDITTHGFRSTFLNWAKANNWSKELRDLQVGHIVRGKVDQAYERDPLVNQRRPMMEEWGQFCSAPAPEPVEAGNVESLAERRNSRRIAS